MTTTAISASTLSPADLRKVLHTACTGSYDVGPDGIAYTHLDDLDEWISSDDCDRIAAEVDSVTVDVVSVEPGDYELGCVDAEITVWAGGAQWSGGVTLYPDHGRPTVGRRHRLGTCGTPDYVWASDEIRRAIDALGNEIIGEIEHAVDQAARKAGL